MFSRILIIAPHTDDGELGCGGSIARFIEDGKEVYYIALSACENEIPEGYPKDILKDECYKATGLLGIPKNNVFIYDFENKNFPHQRQQIFDCLEKLKKDISPDIGFTSGPSNYY
jgi:LmbE family N-acetylglucosaminyl deacetylase